MTVSHTSVFTPMAAELPPGIDDKAMDAIMKDVADNHVATPKGKDQKALEAVVADARSHGIELSIVVIPGNPGHDSNLRDLATVVGKTEHGTVVVLSDDWVGTYSESISRVKLERAEDFSKSQQAHSAQAAQLFVDQLERPEMISWTAITSVLLAGTAIVVGGLYWIKSRRASEDAVPVGVSGRGGDRDSAH
ncbi:Rv1476 family membrane protein [Nocardia sp. NBC_00403]|uniref:Rv1476 family membrane protein n=1 Tax=Nocardia sp. NBC_00403 TaxID=2975990 RepID=UPI002E1EAF5F